MASKRNPIGQKSKLRSLYGNGILNGMRHGNYFFRNAILFVSIPSKDGNRLYL